MAITFMTKATNARDFQTQIDNLNTKLDSVAKNLTYFDFYNIVDVTVNKNNFSAQVNALTPNTSLIINSEPFFLNNVYYNTGDIIFKSSNSNIVHIKAQTGGIYYPNKITFENNSYSIEYKYTPTQPVTGSSTDDEEATKDGIPLGSSIVGGIKEEIKFVGLTTHAPSTIYGLWREFNDGIFDIYYKDNQYNQDNIIQPYIKFYLYDKENNKGPEEVCLDYKLKVENDKWKVEIVDGIPANLWIKVK